MPSCATASPCVPSSYIGLTICAPLPPTSPSKYDSCNAALPVVVERAFTVIDRVVNSSAHTAYGLASTSCSVNDATTPGAVLPLLLTVVGVAVPPPAPPPHAASSTGNSSAMGRDRNTRNLQRSNVAAC